MQFLLKKPKFLRELCLLIFMTSCEKLNKCSAHFFRHSSNYGYHISLISCSVFLKQ